jgi:hypothetical protein
MAWQGYIHITKPAALTTDEFETALREAAGEWALPSNMPHEIPHWCTSTDGTEVILEALWDETKITPRAVEAAFAKVIARLYPKYQEGTLTTNLRDNMVRVAAGKSIQEGHTAALALKATNRTKWEPAIDAGDPRAR